jgi:putative transposase
VARNRFAPARSPRPAPARAAVADDRHDIIREDEDRFIKEIFQAVARSVPAIAAVPPALWQGFARADMERALAAIAEDRPPTQDELDRTAEEAAELARHGMTMEDIIHARRVAVKRACEMVHERATASGVDEGTQLDWLYSMWEWADAIQMNSSAAHREAERELAAGSEEQREWFVRALLHGTLPSGDVHRRAASFGLEPGGRYLAFRARPAEDADERALAREIEATGGERGFGVVVAAVDGDICGVVSKPPRVNGTVRGVIGVGAESELARLDTSFQLATRALDTALAFGLSGVVTIDDLSLRPAILTEGYLGERLVRRYLQPLRELGEFGATLECTVREYLHHGMRIDECARALNVHPNTLRHRLDRFSQLTGTDLRDTEDVLEVWWALERRRLDRATESGE